MFQLFFGGSLYVFHPCYHIFFQTIGSFFGLKLQILVGNRQSKVFFEKNEMFEMLLHISPMTGQFGDFGASRVRKSISNTQIFHFFEKKISLSVSHQYTQF